MREWSDPPVKKVYQTTVRMMMIIVGGDAMITSDNWKALLNDTIHLLRNDCDLSYTEFEDREFIPTILSEIDITTSPFWQYTQWLNSSIERCKTLCFEY